MKKLSVILPLVLTLVLSFACQDKAAMAELEEFKDQAAREEQNKGLAKGIIEEFNKGNVGIWNELCAPGFFYYNPSKTTDPMSLEQSIKAFQVLYSSFPDYSWNIHELIAGEDKVVAWTTFTGTHEGEYVGIPPTGNKINLSIISIFQFREGKCIEVREEEDLLSLMQQLDMALKPKEKK